MVLYARAGLSRVELLTVGADLLTLRPGEAHASIRVEILISERV